MIVTTLPTGADGGGELWKLNHYYERLDEWNASKGIAPTRSPPRRRTRVGDAQPDDRPRRAHATGPTVTTDDRCSRSCATVLDETRETMRRTPQHRESSRS